MAKGDFKLAWKYYGFTDGTIKSCMSMAVSHIDEKSIKYWDNCATFVKSIKYLQVGALSVKQRNWALNIKMDLESKGVDYEKDTI